MQMPFMMVDKQKSENLNQEKSLEFEKGPTFTKEDDHHYQLVFESSVENMPEFISRVYRYRSNESVLGIGDDNLVTERFIFMIGKKKASQNTVTENISDFGYALTTTYTYKYTPVSGFYRMNSISVGGIYTDSGLVFDHGVVYSCNNGQTAHSLPTSHYKYTSFKTTGVVILYGDPAWEPSVSVERNVGQGTGFAVTLYFTRGTGRYDSPWNRYF
jgi:hypothetical protein